MDEEQKALTLLCSSKQVTPSLVGQRQANSHHRALAFVSEQETLVRNLNEATKTKRKERWEGAVRWTSGEE